MVLLVLVLPGYKSPSVKADRTQDNNLTSTTIVSTGANKKATTVDTAQAANLAASVAGTANLSVSDSVSEQSISVTTSAELEQHESATISKPQITDPTAKVEPITSYTTVEGDSVASIAAKFSISEQTVRWANNLTSGTVAVGATVTIPATDGVVYTAKSDSKLEDIASKYQSNIDSIMTANGLDGDTVVSGAKILIPGGTLPDNERPGYRAPTLSTNTNSGTAKPSTTYVPYSAGNTYAYGYCTWYAFNRRVQIGRPLPSNLGNANTWDNRAAAAGYVVNRTPAPGAVFQTDAGYAGHVGVVESINADGTITVSEMNYHGGPGTGWGKVSTRIIPNPGAYKYIH
ncbi:MAG: CHAP domain-containing protein [Sphaerimonospora mesophila]